MRTNSKMFFKQCETVTSRKVYALISALLDRKGLEFIRIFFR